MSEFKSEQIKAVLKDLLKKKKFTYEDVAKELDCSVPTIKRILGPEELSLPRLLQLCDLVEVNLSDLETLIGISKNPDEKFSADQEDFLAKHPHFLAYYMQLFSHSPKEIAEKYKLTDRTTDKYLIGLEKQNLIKVTGKLKVKTSFRQLPSFGNGPLAKRHFENFINNAAHFFIQTISEKIFANAPPQPDGVPQGFSMKSVKVSKASYSAYVKEQEKSRDTFFKLASYEEKSLPPDELKTAVHLEAFAYVPNEDPSLQILEKFFGEIKNI